MRQLRICLCEPRCKLRPARGDPTIEVRPDLCANPIIKRIISTHPDIKTEGGAFGEPLRTLTQERLVRRSLSRKGTAHG